ncbi:MAG: hypothetical protein FWG65_00585, partial [Turicibacter sp.]|nr:hypothetical protein [Turicibacter sp.]
FDVMLDGVITQILATEFTETATKKAFADLAFLLSILKGVHFEMEVDLSLDDLLRFAGYNIELTRKHKVPFLTVIITLNKPKITEYVSDTISFKPIIVCLKDRDGDAAFADMAEKLEQGEPINELELVYLPLYGSKSGKTIYELLSSAIKLTAKIPQSPAKVDKLRSLLILQMGKFVNDEEFFRVLEENSMILENNAAVRVLERRGMERGVKIGEKRGEENGLARAALAMLKEDMDVQKIAQMLSQPIDWVKDLQNRQPEATV